MLSLVCIILVSLYVSLTAVMVAMCLNAGEPVLVPVSVSVPLPVNSNVKARRTMHNLPLVTPNGVLRTVTRHCHGLENALRGEYAGIPLALVSEYVDGCGSIDCVGLDSALGRANLFGANMTDLARFP